MAEVIIPIPRNTYDILQVRVVVPTAFDSNEARKILTQAQINRYSGTFVASFCKPVTIGADCDQPTPWQAERLGAQITNTIGETWLDNDLASLKVLKK